MHQNYKSHGKITNNHIYQGMYPSSNSSTGNNWILETLANLFTSKISCRWLAELLDENLSYLASKSWRNTQEDMINTRRNIIVGSITRDHAQAHYIFGTMTNSTRTQDRTPKGKKVFWLSGFNLMDHMITVPNTTSPWSPILVSTIMKPMFSFV